MVEIKSSKIDKVLLEENMRDIIEILEKNPKRRVKKDGKNRDKKVTSDVIYTVEDFTKYHDVEFIKNVYKKVLLRDVDQETLSRELELLRSGKKSKSEILSTVRFSKEGREKGVHILGIKKRFIMTLLNRIPIVEIFVKIFMLPRFVRRVNGFEAFYLINQKEQSSRIERLERDLNSKIDDVKSGLESKIENVHTDLNSKIDNDREFFSSRVDNLKENMDMKLNSIESSLSQEIDDLKHRIVEIRRAKEQLIEIEKNISNLIESIESENFSGGELVQSLKREKSSNLDELYISFEDKFRGGRDDIKKRQSYYIKIVEGVIKEPKKELIVDIGCGRGEWLELLKERRFRGKGVDLNRLMVKESRELGLDVVNSDGVEFLKSLNSNSVAVVTAFHIVEHLPFELLISLFDESYRVLKSGGLIIFETPNPENLMVGSNTFYTDPTHKNPIPPVTLEFLAKNRGFRDVEIHRLHPVKKPSFVNIENGEDLNSLIFASTKAQDYSVVGLK
jgi:O-antigen chain-terminating methyltransferase